MFFNSWQRVLVKYAIIYFKRHLPLIYSESMAVAILQSSDSTYSKPFTLKNFDKTIKYLF